MFFLSMVSVLFLASVHLFAAEIFRFKLRPRSRWLSLAGGISVAYIFVHLLPELNEKQEIVADYFGVSEGFEALEGLIYSVALLGVLFFYAMEKTARSQFKASSPVGNVDSGIFWLHIGSFGLYNIIIGYLLVHRLDDTASGLMFYLFSMALHFVVNDYGLIEHHKRLYKNKGRLLLAMAPLLGWLLGLSVNLHETVIALLFSFLAGGVILNVLKEELPDERESSVPSFLIGAIGYSIILRLAA
jgi:zinc transporter ZupT